MQLGTFIGIGHFLGVKLMEQQAHAGGADGSRIDLAEILADLMASGFGSPLIFSAPRAVFEQGTTHREL